MAQEVQLVEKHSGTASDSDGDVAATALQRVDVLN